ncbi:pilus assembly protein [Sessilibacter sp. MAH4]
MGFSNHKVFLRARTFSHVAFTSALTLATCHSAFAVNLPDRPLLTEASIEPNVMLTLDDSGSMTNGFNSADFDSGRTYSNTPNNNNGQGTRDCPRAIAIPDLGDRLDNLDDAVKEVNRIVARTDADGNAFFTHLGVDYAWGTSNERDVRTGLPQRCFLSGGRYFVQYSDDFEIEGASGGNSIFTFGNFWNYYFSNEDGTDGDNWGEEDQKFGVGERIEVAQDAAKLLLRSLDGVRIGLGGFDNGVGGTILAEIDSIDAVVGTQNGVGITQRELLIDRINDIVAEGSTPLGETLSEMGRYFVEGFLDQPLILHPNDVSGTPTGTESVETAGRVFNNEPLYLNGTRRPTAERPVIQAFCQRNFTVMLTDGAPQSDSRHNPLLENYDEDGFDSRFGNDVFDDIALALYDIDLRPDLNEFDGDPVRNNVSTYVIAGFDGVGVSTVLTNVVNNGIGFGVDENVGPGTLYEASDGDALVDAFDRIFEEIFSSAGSLTSVTFNSGSLELDTALYQATFSRTEFLWNGELVAFPIDENTGLFSLDAAWNASRILDARVAANGHEDRSIYTMGNNNDGISFVTSNWGQLTATQQNDLRGGGTPAQGRDVLNYLRGESNPLFRDRTTSDGRLGLLGDIVNSSPIEVGEPELNYPDPGVTVGNGTVSTAFGTASRPYSQFRAANAGRESIVYVGSNDGMMHAFRGSPEDGGQEVFAYIPSQLFDSSRDDEGLFFLTNERYDHRFYVDGPLTASDIFIDPNGGSSDRWRTVVVGALRAGGRGIYALDVTDPSTLSNPNNAADVVLWEFDGDDSPNMGYVYGEIRVALMANGKWAAIVGNGYNSDNEEARLFIIFFEEGADGTWSTGEWVELETGVANDNGMGAPVLADLDGDFIVDRIYSGDIRGNMWVFDVSSDNPNNWGSAYTRSNGEPQPLFTARNDSNQVQAITTQPIITRNPDTVTTGNGANVLVFFGTGKFIEQGDYTDLTQMSFYAVWDRGDGSLDRGDLEPRILTTTTITNADGEEVITRQVSGDQIRWFNGSEGEWGWFMDFPEPGERVIVEPSILQGSLFFASSIPTTSACSNGGQGFLNSVSTNGLASETPLFDVNGDGRVDIEDLGYVGETVLDGLPSGAAYIGGGDTEDPCPAQNGQYQAYSTSSGEIQYRWVCPEDGSTTGRLSWQELLSQ